MRVAVFSAIPVVAVLSLLLAAASAGFLALNFPPARIFMGDVGSQFLGFAFAALGVLLARSDSTGTIILIVPLLLFHFVFDTAFTVLRRLAAAAKTSRPHIGHIFINCSTAPASATATSPARITRWRPFTVARRCGSSALRRRSAGWFSWRCWRRKSAYAVDQPPVVLPEE